jgi:hypothetical protein
MSDYTEKYHIQQPKERPCGILHKNVPQLDRRDRLPDRPDLTQRQHWPVRLA